MMTIFQPGQMVVDLSGGVDFRMSRALGPTTLIYDTFTDADGVHLHDHTIAPTNIPGTAWIDSSLGPTLTILSNRAYPVGGRRYNILDAGTPNIQIDVNYAIAQNYIYFRYSAYYNMWYVYFTTGNAYLYEVASGMYTIRASGAIPAGSLATVKTTNPLISFYIDGGLIFTYSSSFLASQTKCGLSLNGGYFDDFKVYQL
jgi:hypothetical protein